MARLKLSYPAEYPNSWKVSIVMPVSTKKVILFASAVDGKVRHLWPVAVFNDAKGAKSYAGFVKLAHATGDETAIAALDPSYRKDPEGKPLKVEKFSIVEVPYAPQPIVAEFDEVETPAPATT